MVDIFLITQLIASNPETQKFCADFVGIPYASDTFTDKQWEEFQSCMTFFERQQRRQTPPQAPVSAPVWSEVTPPPVVPLSASQAVPWSI